MVFPRVIKGPFVLGTVGLGGVLLYGYYYYTSGGKAASVLMPRLFLPKDPPATLGPQARFMWEQCLPNPLPGDTSIPVLFAPRGWRKTTVARQVAAVSDGAVIHLTREDLEAMLGPSKGPVVNATVTIPAGPQIVFETDTGKIYDFLRSKVPKSCACAILDDLTKAKGLTVSPQDLREFVKDLRSVVPGKQVVIITSNEAFKSCVEDPETVGEWIRMVPFPAPTEEELLLAVRDALLKRHQGDTQNSFTMVDKEITAELITKEVVETVTAQLPSRHGHSMRVWGKLLSQPEAAVPSVAGKSLTPETLRANLLKALRSRDFLLSVAEGIDLNVHPSNRVFGLTESIKMRRSDVEKLATLLGKKLTLPETFSAPGRLVLISMLKMAEIDDSLPLCRNLEEKVVQPEINDIIAKLNKYKAH